jgi:CrcB protein
MLYVYVALGSALGGMSRYGLTLFVQDRTPGTFPLATLLINVSGSLLLGFIVRYALGTEAISPEVRLLLTTGFCGGYTTFSTFSYETVRAIEDGQYGQAAIYVTLSVVLAAVGTFGGFAAARSLLAMRARE